MQVQFCGATRTTTGSMFLLEVNQQRILLECGLYQGRRSESNDRNKNFPFDPAELDLHGSAAKLATGLSELSQGVDQNNGPTYWNYSVRPDGSKVISKRTKSPVSETVTHKHYYIGDRRIGYHVQDTQMVIDEARGEVAFLVGERHFQPVR